MGKKLRKGSNDSKLTFLIQAGGVPGGVTPQMSNNDDFIDASTKEMEKIADVVEAA